MLLPPITRRSNHKAECRLLWGRNCALWGTSGKSGQARRRHGSPYANARSVCRNPQYSNGKLKGRRAAPAPAGRRSPTGSGTAFRYRISFQARPLHQGRASLGRPRRLHSLRSRPITLGSAQNAGFPIETLGPRMEGHNATALQRVFLHDFTALGMATIKQTARHIRPQRARDVIDKLIR